MKKTLKRVSAMVLTGLLVFTMLPATQVLAAENQEQYYQVETLENGITVESVTTVYPTLARSNTKRASTTSTFKQDGKEIGTVTLDVTFGYDYSSSWVTSTSYSKSLKSGWSYNNHKITTSGGKATLTANLKKFPLNVPVDISLKCSSSGTIS